MNAPDARTGEAMLLATTDQAPAVAWRCGPALPSVRPCSLPELMADCLQRFPDVPVLCEGDREATWRDLDAWSGRLAATWAAHLPAGACCAILMPNGLAHLLAELACWRLGAIAAPIFLGFGPQRLGGLLQRLQPQLALVDDATAAGALPVGCRRLGSAEVWAAIARP